MHRHAFGREDRATRRDLATLGSARSDLGLYRWWRLHTGKARSERTVARWRRCLFMEVHPAVLPSSPVSSLVALAGRCLREPASRRLDGEIYCALHNIEDINDLSDHNLVEARENGWVLVEHQHGAGRGWIEAPPFTAELQYAETLVPEGLATIARDPRIVWAAALHAPARTSAPAPRGSSIFEFCRG